jgi:hypothetical protein
MLDTAAERGEVAYVTSVAEICDEAERLLKNGEDDAALALFRVVADLDIDDRLIEPAVDHARRLLEARGLGGPPSIDASYQQHLAQLPPQQRHLMLARQCIRELSSAPGPKRAEELRASAIEHFEQARALGALGKKDERVYLGLRRGSPTKG